MKLYGYFRSSASFRVRIALNLKGLMLDAIFVHLPSGEQNRADYQQSINPQGLIPSLETDNGDVLAQSLAILEYLDEIHPEPALLPSDAIGRARVRHMAQLIACDIHPLNNLRVLKYLKDPLDQDQDAVNTWYRHWIAKGFKALEVLLGQYGGDYCFGDQVTLADTCLVPQAWNARRFDCDLSPYPKLVEIDARLNELEAVKQALPEHQPDAA